jgi:hypothetical protein
MYGAEQGRGSKPRPRRESKSRPSPRRERTRLSRLGTPTAFAAPKPASGPNATGEAARSAVIAAALARQEISWGERSRLPRLLDATGESRLSARQKVHGDQEGTNAPHPNTARQSPPLDPSGRQTAARRSSLESQTIVRFNRDSGRSPAMFPHLTLWEILLAVGLRTLWLTPDWVLKVVAAAEAIRRFRRGRGDRGA